MITISTCEGCSVVIAALDLLAELSGDVGDNSSGFVSMTEVSPNKRGSGRSLTMINRGKTVIILVRLVLLSFISTINCNMKNSCIIYTTSSSWKKKDFHTNLNTYLKTSNAEHH